MQIITDDLSAVKQEFTTPRRTEIVEADMEMEDEDLIQREDMVITVSHAGYIKRVPLATYRAQRRGGKGRAGMQTREEDFVTRLFVASTHTPILFFSTRGMVYQHKVWRMPLAAPQARGKALINLLPLQQGERITSIMPLPEDEGQWGELDVMFATVSGTVRRNKLSDFTGIRQNGKIAMKLDESDEIAGVETCSEYDDVLLTTAKGRCIRFSATDVRVFKGRDSTGVRGINLGKDDHVISLSIICHFEATSPERIAFLKARRAADDPDGEGAEIDEEENGDTAVLSVERYEELLAAEQVILTVSENGFGKRTSSYEYRVTGRGGKGIVAMTVNKRNGPLIASFPVAPDDEIMLVSDGGQLIRCPVGGIRVVARSTKGVTIFDTAEDEKVVSVERITEDDDDENGEEADVSTEPTDGTAT